MANNTCTALCTTIIDSYVIKTTYSAIRQHLDTYIVCTNLHSKEERELVRTKDLNTAKDVFFQAVGCMFIELDESIDYE
jgi:hypothetical protein